MNKKEKALFKALCKFEEDKFDAGLLAYASPEVLGHLFANRRAQAFSERYSKTMGSLCDSSGHRIIPLQ